MGDVIYLHRLDRTNDPLTSVSAMRAKPARSGLSLALPTRTPFERHLSFVKGQPSQQWLPVALDGVEHDRLERLLPEVVAGIRTLLIEPAPEWVDRGSWYDMAFDAAQFAVSGRMRTAFDLGWDVYDLFGCPTADGGEELLGLVAKLKRRGVVDVTAEGVLVDDNAGERMIWRCRPQHDRQKLLWDHHDEVVVRELCRLIQPSTSER